MQPYESLLLLLLSVIHLTSCKSAHPMVCAGDLDNVCESNLCFDAFDIMKNMMRSGCADNSICESAGCSMVKHEFVCCCPHSICNGKSEGLIKARLRLWKRENPGNNQPLPITPTPEVKSTNTAATIKSATSLLVKAGIIPPVKSRTTTPQESQSAENHYSIKQTLQTLEMPVAVTMSSMSMTVTSNGSTEESREVSNDAHDEKETFSSHPENSTNTTTDDDDEKEDEKETTTTHLFLLTRKPELDDISNLNSSKIQDSEQMSGENQESMTSDEVAIDSTSATHFNESSAEEEEEKEKGGTNVWSAMTASPEIIPSRPQGSTASISTDSSETWTTSTVPQNEIIFADSTSTVTHHSSIETETDEEASSSTEAAKNETMEIETGPSSAESTTEQPEKEDELLKVERLYPHISDEDVSEYSQDNDTEYEGLEVLEKPQITTKGLTMLGTTTTQVTKSTDDHFHPDADEDGDDEDKAAEVDDDDGVDDDDDDNNNNDKDDKDKDKDDDSGDDNGVREEYDGDDRHETTARIIDNDDIQNDDEKQQSEVDDDVSHVSQEIAEETTSPPLERKTSTLRVERGKITKRPRDRNLDSHEESSKSIWKSGVIPWWLVAIFGLLVATLTGGVVYKVIKARRSRKAKLESGTAQEMTPLKKTTESAE